MKESQGSHSDAEPGRKMNLRRVNLNLLPVLQALLECRSVSRAAERLGLSQPTTSAALGRLRRTLGDDLLVQFGREMLLTPKAEQIREPLAELLPRLEETIAPDIFDPLQWTGEFVIASADYAAVVILPPLLKRLSVDAPTLTVRMTNLGRESVNNMRGSLIDMIIAPPKILRDANLMTRRLFTDRFVCIYWRHRSNPPATLDLEGYMKEEHVTTLLDTVMPDSHASYARRELDELRDTQRNAAMLPYYSVLPSLVIGTRYIALVQEQLARRLREYMPIEIIDPPVPIEPIDIGMVWSPHVQKDRAHSWMRQVVSEVCMAL